MKRIFPKCVFLVFAVFLVTSLLSGCAGKDNTVETSSPTTGTTAAVAASSADAAKSVYPLNTNVKLVYWNQLNPNVSANYVNMGDTPFAQEWSKRTGIEVEYIHSTTDESFALMMASNDLPDIIEYWWDAYPGGASKALENGQIISLNSIMEQYAPNFTKFLKDHPDLDKQIRWDEGYYIGFPCVLDDGGKLSVGEGPLIRKDLLDKLGLGIPETVDEWYTALSGFKSLGVSAPFTGSGGYKADFIARAYGVQLGINIVYLENGKVVFGPLQPGYKDFLATWRKWYVEGLIDKDIATIDSSLAKAKLLDGSAGSECSYVSHIYNYNSASQDKIPGYKLVGAPMPVLNKGDVNNYSYLYNAYDPADVQAVITKQCKNPDIAARFLDYLWSEEGSMLANWGILGKTYTINEKGEPHYTDFVLKNPDNWTIFKVKGGYMRSYASGPFAQDSRITAETYLVPEQFEAIERWSKGASKEHLMPPLRRTADEDTEYTTIMTEVQTYSDECLLKFMLGNMSLDEFDKFIAQLKSLKVERALEIQQAAYERYLKK